LAQLEQARRIAKTELFDLDPRQFRGDKVAQFMHKYQQAEYNYKRYKAYHGDIPLPLTRSGPAPRRSLASAISGSQNYKDRNGPI
jgi:hypothetical protein